jgi:hypothetical protein
MTALIALRLRAVVEFCIHVENGVYVVVCLNFAQRVRRSAKLHLVNFLVQSVPYYVCFHIRESVYSGINYYA